MANDLKALVRELIAPAVAGDGVELFDIEIAGAKHAPVVRVYVDKAGGIGMDDIAQASRVVSAILDDNDVITGRYTLEVSSPGIDRPLRHLDDVTDHIGEKAQFTLTEAIAGRKRFTGVIVRMTGDAAVLDVEGAGEVEIPWGIVSKAHLKGEIDLAPCDDNAHSEEGTKKP